MSTWAEVKPKEAYAAPLSWAERERELRENMTCRGCRWYVMSIEKCYVNPPTPVVHHVHGIIGIRPTSKPEDFCSQFTSK